MVDKSLFPAIRPVLWLSAILALLVFTQLSMSSAVRAHPADELCGPGSEMDPALCRTLSELDRPDEPPESAPKIEVERSFWQTARLYIKLGFIHILPLGYDHILFVLALFLGAASLRSLIGQISVFTIAHTLTLGLAAMGLINVPGNIIEPLIALSIAIVAIENIFFRHLTRWRPIVVFGFGLFHGLGFAGVLRELGLVQQQFLTSLFSFNIGVELGQLVIISMAALFTLLIKQMAQRRLGQDNVATFYYRWIVRPGSLIIAILGLVWFVRRIFGL
ncbi:MAG: HupE/UreJ family protein [bacterium]